MVSGVGGASNANSASSAKINRVTAETKPRFTFVQRLALAVVPRLVWALLWVIGLTWRFEVIAEEGVTPDLFGLSAGP